MFNINTILITGGAGYIGSHAVYLAIKKGYEVIVIDNLSTGHKKHIHKNAVFYEGDIREEKLLKKIFSENSIDQVLHFAAKSIVSESMSNPLKYYENNVYGTQVLLKAMREFNVKNIVFSSTAAVYGTQEQMPLTEKSETKPTSVYGETKLAMEKMINWCSKSYDLNYIALRYFNVAGAIKDASIGEDHLPETHLIPKVLKTSIDKDQKITVFGDDYNTPDGTCIRDYIHVIDLIEAHLSALDYLSKNSINHIINLGTNNGISVMEIIKKSSELTGIDIPYNISSRRQGDPDKLIASNILAHEVLGWSPKHSVIDEIISDAWNWHKKGLN